MAIDPVMVGAKWVHVTLAAAWLGLVGLHAIVVSPLLRAATPATRREFSGRFIVAAVRWNNILGGLTLVSGLVLVYVGSGSLRFEGDWGRYVAFALVVNLAVLYLINIAVARSWRALEKARADERPETPPSARAVFLDRRIAVNVWLSLFLLVFAAFAMVLANLTGRP